MMQTFFLWNALTIVPDRKQSIAVVGGGGKTSLIFRNVIPIMHLAQKGKSKFFAIK